MVVVVRMEQLQGTHGDAKNDGSSPKHICEVLGRHEKLSSVSIKRRAKSKKIELWWAIFIEGVPMTVKFGDDLNSIF